MSRLFPDPVEVLRRDGDPDQFLWRGRHYVVREVLGRWTESGQWWRAPAVHALASGDASSEVGAGSAPAPLETAPIPPSPKWAQRAWGEPAPDVGASVAGGAGLDDGERDWWRVEAGSGSARASGAGTGVYDLCFAWSTGAWVLARVLD